MASFQDTRSRGVTTTGELSTMLPPLIQVQVKRRVKAEAKGPTNARRGKEVVPSRAVMASASPAVLTAGVAPPAVAGAVATVQGRAYPFTGLTVIPPWACTSAMRT